MNQIKKSKETSILDLILISLGLIFISEIALAFEGGFFSWFFHKCAWGLLYCLPAIKAYRDRHPKSLAIVGVNLLLGWMVLPWLIALLWSANKPWHSENNTPLLPTSKACPFCAETILQAAIKCKHCASTVIERSENNGEMAESNTAQLELN